MISGFRREGDEICALLGYYVAYRGNSLPTFRDRLLGFLTLGDGTDGLSRKVGTELPLYAA